MVMPSGAGTLDRFSDINLTKDNYVELPQISAPSGNPKSNTGWLYVKDNGGTTYLYFEDDAGAVTDLITGANPAWDDFASPDANKTHAFTTYTSTFTGTSTAADQWNFQGLGNFGDVSVVRIESKTGNPTDGTVLEVVSHDTDADAFLVTANSTNVILAYGTGNVDIVGATGVINYTDFDVDADGKVIITSDDGGSLITFTPSAAAVGIDASNATLTNAIDVGANTIAGTTAVINFDNFDVDASGNLTAVDGTFSGNLSVNGTIKQDALVPASGAPHAITVDGAGTGGVTIGATSTGAITLGGGATAVNLPSTVDLTLAGGVISVTDTANSAALSVTNNTLTTANLLTLTANAQTSGNGVSYANSGAVLTGSAFYAGVTDGAGFTGYYFRAYDGGADDFSVRRYGATVIAGNASGTDALTLTNGDVLVSSGHVDMTAGDLTLAEGKITVDTAADLASYVKRNFAGAGTGAVFQVNDDNTASTNIALDVNQDGTGASTGIRVIHDGDNPTLSLSAGAARTGNVIDITMANQLAERAINITGAITSTAGQGVIEVHGTGVIPATATLLRLDADTAQPGDGDGYMMNIDDDTLVVATPSKYAVLIDSNANEALHVATGKSLFDETATFTAGIDSNGAVDIDLADNANLVNIDNAAVDLAAGAGVTTIYGSGAAGQTNASYLLRLAWKADADAQDGFLLLQDNSTGAAANGDQKLKIGTEGTITMGAGSTGTGGALIYSFEDLTIANAGTAASIVQVVTLITTDGNGDEDNCTLADGTVGQVKIFVSKTEGAGGDSYKITPAHMQGGTKITFDGVVGDGCTMIFDGTNWNIVSNNGGVIS
jgi:hypothetical protein